MTTPADIIRIPLPDDDLPDDVTCPECHGAESFACINGCHEYPCDYCDGNGTVTPEELPG